MGELFQSYAVGKSRKNISALMDIRPDYANVERNGELAQVDPDEVEVGAVIVVRPGEKIPIDGVVIEGVSTLDTSALTGESVPREVRSGDEVISGCINLSGLLRLRTTKEFGESTVSRILDMVENATSKKSRSEAFISRFARIYTPAVCGCALALALLPPLFLLLRGQAPGWGDWIYRALTFLVISCPCALVISIPLSFFAGIGGASREGVLVKGSNYLEALSKTRVVAFDKTGTMTMGVFEVNGIHHSSMDNEKLLELAAHAEIYSTHPIARSIQKAYLEGAVFRDDGEPVGKKADHSGRQLDEARVSDVMEIGGNGITTRIDGKQVAVGNARLMDSLGIAYVDCRHVGTVVHVAVDGAYAGHLLVSDIVKPTAKEAIRALRAAGVTKTVMLTGDAKRVGEAVAAELGIDEVQAELLPGDKVAAVETLLANKPERSVLAYRDGRARFGRRHRGRGRRADGRRSEEDRAGDPDRKEMHAHRVRKYLVCHRGQAHLPGTGRRGRGQHVAGDLCGRGRDGAGGAQRHPCAVHEGTEAVSARQAAGSVDRSGGLAL